jgi:hypothetical protein
MPDDEYNTDRNIANYIRSERPDHPGTVTCPHCGATIVADDYSKMSHMRARHKDILRKRLQRR